MVKPKAAERGCLHVDETPNGAKPLFLFHLISEMQNN